MYGVGRKGADAEHCLEGIGPRPQMRDRPQIFERMAFLLERIVRSRGALYPYFLSLYLKGLLRLRSGNKSPADNYRRTHVQRGYLLEIAELIRIHHLDGIKISPVIYHYKAEGL